jgi:hypothetical protein
VNWAVVPVATVSWGVVTAIETSVEDVTVSVSMPTIVPLVAVMTVVPPTRPMASPVAEIEAVAAVAEAQVTVAEMSFFMPSL